MVARILRFLRVARRARTVQYLFLIADRAEKNYRNCYTSHHFMNFVRAGAFRTGLSIKTGSPPAGKTGRPL